MLYLASESPRRRELLQKLGIPFVVEKACVKELEQTDVSSVCSLALLPQMNSRLKAEAVSLLHPGDAVIGADTSIIFKERMLGKPRGAEDARVMLGLLSGETHQVITGVTVMRSGKCPFLRSWSVVSTVTFKILTPEIIDAYMSLVNVLDKAGAYAIQDRGDMIVQEFTGDLDNIIGLPVESLRPLFAAGSPLLPL